mmetsp:Transcript_107885/g.311732  ORF Transcript_107885/g.311732 Transcript_107885/m.311732 type:complete len:291 (-) Transcript_107885:34-906(-)
MCSLASNEALNVFSAVLRGELPLEVVPPPRRFGRRRGAVELRVYSLVALLGGTPHPHGLERMWQLDQLPRPLVGHLVLGLHALRRREDLRIEHLRQHADLQHAPEGRLATGVFQHVLPCCELRPSVGAEGVVRQLRHAPLVGRLGKGVLDALRRREILVHDSATAHQHLRRRGGRVALHDYDELPRLVPPLADDRVWCRPRRRHLGEGGRDHPRPRWLKGAVTHIGHLLIIRGLQRQRPHGCGLRARRRTVRGGRRLVRGLRLVVRGPLPVLLVAAEAGPHCHRPGSLVA